MKINVLGTEYTIKRRKEADDPKLRDCDGYCDSSIKQIVVETFERDARSKEDLWQYEKEVLRHEIVHAFLDESGLRSCTHSCGQGWARNEEMVDWIAIQAPKLFKAFREGDCL